MQSQYFSLKNIPWDGAPCSSKFDVGSACMPYFYTDDTCIGDFVLTPDPNRRTYQGQSSLGSNNANNIPIVDGLNFEETILNTTNQVSCNYPLHLM